MLTSSELYAAGYEAAVRGQRPDRWLWQWPSYRAGFRHGGKDGGMPELRPGRQQRRPRREKSAVCYIAPAAPPRQTMLF